MNLDHLSFEEVKNKALDYLNTYKIPEIRIYGYSTEGTQYLASIIKYTLKEETTPYKPIIPPAPVVPSIPNPRYYWLFNEDLGKRAKLVNTDIKTYPGYT